MISSPFGCRSHVPLPANLAMKMVPSLYGMRRAKARFSPRSAAVVCGVRPRCMFNFANSAFRSEIVSIILLLIKSEASTSQARQPELALPVAGRFDFGDYKFGARDAAQRRREADHRGGADYPASILRSSCADSC